ncbi:MAG: motility associated factor glycosyltransferase family protein [Spirochaetales bacterium]|jgi:hypothetical protein|nr:motility associated factor glycosyltransferase family protein [Spirochaetales bacterium]
MSYFLRNFAGLRKAFPNFSEPDPDSKINRADIEILQASSGVPTARIKGTYIHSPRDPEREANRFIENWEEKNCAVLFGFGLGYYAEAFLSRYPEIPLIIVEPDKDFFFEALKIRNLTDIFASKNVSLLLDGQPDALATVLNTINTASIGAVSPRSLTRHNEAYFSRLQAVIDSFIERRTINRNTLKRFGRRWIRNLSDNLPYLPEGERLASLHGLYRGLPALILAAGPSLDEVLPFLHELSQKCVVIAVDTSLRACSQAGVSPDFLVIVDPQYWNARHLDSCDTSDLVLITESATYPMVLRNKYKAVFFGDSLFPLGAYIEKSLGSFGKLGAGGSVATSAWDAARTMGCSPIISAGLDLGFPNRNTHFKGGRFEDFQLNGSDRFTTTETGSFLMLNDADPFFVDANNGKQVLTDRRLITYKWWFENQIKMYPEINCKNLSINGLKIDGMEFCEYREILTFPEIRKKKEFIFKTVTDYSAAERVDSRAVMQSALNRLLADLKDLRNLAKEAGKLAETLDSAQGEELQALLDRLSEIDVKLLHSSSKDVAGFLVQDVAETIIENSSSSSSLKDVKASSLRMYRELELSAEYHLLYLAGRPGAAID